MIPKLIHFIWIDNPITQGAEFNINTFRQEGWEVRIHTDASLLNPLYEKNFNRSKHVPMRTDLLRYSILQQQPGWYCDADARCLGDLNTLRDAVGDCSGKVVTASDNCRTLNWIVATDGSYDWSLINEWITNTVHPSNIAWYGAHMWFFNNANVELIPHKYCSIGPRSTSIIAHGYKD